MHRHSFYGKKYSRNKGPRELMLKNLATSVILHEKVKTTTVKAKGIQPIVEKMITLAKKSDLASNRAISRYLLDEQARIKLMVELAPLYKGRVGGYTRITKFGQRVGDNAEMAIIELLDMEKLDREKDKKIDEAKKVVKPDTEKIAKKKSPGKPPIKVKKEVKK